MADAIEMLLANAAAEGFTRPQARQNPARVFAILTCMDARLDLAKLAGPAESDAHVIRNAGGPPSDGAIRSLIISSKLLGTKERFVIHRTDCGMLTFTNEIMRDLLSQKLETASLATGSWKYPASGGGSTAGNYIEWLTIDDQAASVIVDVHCIRAHPPVPKTIPVCRYIYDVATGKLSEGGSAPTRVAAEAQGYSCG